MIELEQTHQRQYGPAAKARESRALRETELQLLMHDGPVRLAFHPLLTPEQYAELVEIVDASATKAELLLKIQGAANRWQREFDFDESSLD